MILGGGLAGLSAAYHSDGLVYEGETRVGGHAKSARRDGFVFDEGIHVLHTRNQYVLDLLDRTGANLRTHQREAWIQSFGALTRYPFQANTFGLPIPIVKDCLLGFIENEFKDRDAIRHYEDWIQFMFGKGIARHFMVPYSQKFWGLPPSTLTTEWVSVRHPRPTLDEVLEGALRDQTKGFGINAEFQYPERGGFGAIGEALAATVADRVRLGMRVTRIDARRRQIEFNDRDVVPYDRVLCTIPLPEVVRVLVDPPADVVEAASRLRCNRILVVNLGINRPGLTNKHWIYYPEREFSFFRISFPFNKGPHMVPPGCSSVSAEVAFGPYDAWPPSRDEMIARVEADLRRAGILEPADAVVFAEVIPIKYGYVVFDTDRRPAVKTIHSFLEAHDIHPCGRYGEWAYLWSDEAILSGRKAAERLAGGRR